MKLLLDTHAFLWFVEGDSRLSKKAVAAIADSNNLLFLSVASIWEMAIKVHKEKLILSQPLDQFITTWVTFYRIDKLSIESKHAIQTALIPAFHNDPFDRMLVAQTIQEDMVLVSGDQKISAYSVPILW